MAKTLTRRGRDEWNRLIATEGKVLGLSECRPFLENKLVNDIFYEGEFKGGACVVKCSSHAPESIMNEYEMSRRLAAIAPVCAEALAKWRSPDGRRAFVVTRRLPGPSLTDLLVRGVDDMEAVGILEDMVSIAEALLKGGIVWRDIIPENFLMDADGHLKLIDAQFAIDRGNFREDPFLNAHWRYRMLLFAHHPMMAGRGWNDVGMMLRYARYLPLAAATCADPLLARLRELERQSAFPMAYGAGDSVRMALYLPILAGQWVFAVRSRRRRALRERMGRAWRVLTGRRR